MAACACSIWLRTAAVLSVAERREQGMTVTVVTEGIAIGDHPTDERRMGQRPASNKEHRRVDVLRL
jgi:hypothetical protein